MNIVLAVSVLITGNMIGWLAVFSAITRNLLIGIGLAVLCALMVINGLLLLKKKWAGVIITRSRYCIQSILWLVLLIIGFVKAQSNVYLPAAAMLVLQNILLVAAFRYYKPRRNYMK